MPAQEVWKEVPGFPDYEVSSLGQVASIKGGKFRVLAGGKTDTGYRNVLLYSGGRRVGRRVHSLVALAFYGPRPKGLEVRHLDGNQLNNAAANLRYGTHAENMADRRRHRGLLLIVGRDPESPAGNRVECRNGHALTSENVYVDRAGKGSCRPCASATTRRYRQRRALRAASVPSERAA